MQSEEGAAGAEDSLTSTEFDRFLAERAAAAENLPTISKEEKSLLAEVNESKKTGTGPQQVVPSSANSSNPESVEDEEKMKRKKKTNPEESLIEF